uniref:Ribonuclease A-domain domain-containing protein n=1 Tax=Sander lucioperca TaxID=283035 RepID=A0A8C9Z9H0_SANLU
MKISIFAGVLECEANVAWFRNQLIGEEMHEDDCTNGINGRGIKKDDGSCKWSNTFIRASLEAVAAVCKTAALKGNLHESKTTFDLILCEQTKEMAAKKDKPPNCPYKKGELKKNRKIVIGCDKYGPIHFEKLQRSPVQVPVWTKVQSVDW